MALAVPFRAIKMWASAPEVRWFARDREECARDREIMNLAHTGPVAQLDRAAVS